MSALKNKNLISEICIFCELINHKDNLIYEDNKTAAFLDLYPVEKAHVLIIPKKHFRTWLETDKEYLTSTNLTTQFIAKCLKKTYPEIKGFNIVINNEKAANQQVFHFHIHLIPKFIEDAGFVTLHKMSESAKVELETTKKTIQNALKNKK